MYRNPEGWNAEVLRYRFSHYEWSRAKSTGVPELGVFSRAGPPRPAPPWDDHPSDHSTVHRWMHLR
jgi:hypothetical protein